MRSVQVSKSKGPLEIVEKDIPEPAQKQVRIKVQALRVIGGSIARDRNYLCGSTQTAKTS
jgi:NADPH:quinone reductase-like Zn-dependent oxidoreductase